MAVQANWHNADLEVDDSDPFAVEQEGLPIDLDNDVATLSRRISRSVEKEGRLAERGVTCGIKDSAGTSCWSCPVYKGGTTHSLASLCRLGREQERLVTRLVVETQKENS